MCMDNSKCSCESDAFERLISCEKLQCVEIACFAVSKQYLLFFFSTLLHKLLLFFFSVINFLSIVIYVWLMLDH